MTGDLQEKNLKGGREREKELLWALLLRFLLIPMGLAHVLLGQPLLVPGNLADAQGKMKRVQFCRLPPPVRLARAQATRLVSTFCHHSDREVSKHHLQFTGRALVPKHGGVVLTRV